MERSYDAAETLIQAVRGSYIKMHSLSDKGKPSYLFPQCSNQMSQMLENTVLPYDTSIFAPDNTVTIQSGN